MHFRDFQLTVGLLGHNPIQSRGPSVCARGWTGLLINNAWMLSQNGFPKWMRETCEQRSYFLILLNIVQKSQPPWGPNPPSTTFFSPLFCCYFPLYSALPPNLSPLPAIFPTSFLPSFFSGHFSPPIFLFCFLSFIIAMKYEMFDLQQEITTMKRQLSLARKTTLIISNL